MTFKQLVARLGGPHKAAARLHVTRHSIHRWLNGERTPQPRHARKIIALSGGKISYNDLLRRK